MLTVEPLGTTDRDVDEAAELLAREHVRARDERPGLPAAYAAPEHCRHALGRLVGDAHGFLARDQGSCVGVVCGRTIDAVGFVPAEGFAVDPAAHDPTTIVVGLFAELMPVLVAEGAGRFTVDHVDLAGPSVAVHPLARHHDADVGLLTLEPTPPAPRLCPAGQPYIGPTATDPAVRGRGIGRALVDAAHDWAHRHGHHTISVDFEPSNPLSRPFWLGLGFRPSGYRQRRTIGHPPAPD
jgi:GNAT superfamily N-acetyltransferase